MELLKNDIKKTQNELESLNESYNQKVDETRELDKKIQQGKMYMELESAIEELKKQKESMQEEINNYYDIKDLVFAEYRVKEEDSFNLGIFLMFLSDYGNNNGVEERCYLYRNIFVPRLIAGLNRKKQEMSMVCGK